VRAARVRKGLDAPVAATPAPTHVAEVDKLFKDDDEDEDEGDADGEGDGTAAVTDNNDDDNEDTAVAAVSETPVTPALPLDVNDETDDGRTAQLLSVVAFQQV
jgi:hypothetical protein